MARKPETLEDIATQEANALKEREANKLKYLQDQAELARHVPARFFKLATELRECVMRFNAHAAVELRVSWRESAALAARDPNLNLDFNLSMTRGECEISLGLTQLGRAGKPEAYLIEAMGVIPDNGFMLRVDGSMQKGKPVYRITMNFKKLEFPDEELAERMVKTLVKASTRELTRRPGELD